MSLRLLVPAIITDFLDFSLPAEDLRLSDDYRLLPLPLGDISAAKGSSLSLDSYL